MDQLGWRGKNNLNHFGRVWTDGVYSTHLSAGIRFVMIPLQLTVSMSTLWALRLWHRAEVDVWRPYYVDSALGNHTVNLKGSVNDIQNINMAANSLLCQEKIQWSNGVLSREWSHATSVCVVIWVSVVFQASLDVCACEFLFLCVCVSHWRANCNCCCPALIQRFNESVMPSLQFPPRLTP